MPTPSIVSDYSSWKFQQSHVERLMDHAALTSAHPDDTLILAGPARWGGAGMEETGTAQPDLYTKLLPIGMVQSFNAMMQKPTQPMQAIGSGRLFYVSGKSQGNAQIARLFVNGRNLLRVLYTNAVQAQLDPSRFDDKACVESPAGSGGLGENSKFFINLDSELFLIPFGLACFFRDKSHNKLGAFYLELCMINSYNISFNAGQNLVLENVSLLFDRAWPIAIADNSGGPTEPPGSLIESNLLSPTLLGSNLSLDANIYGDLSKK